MLSSNDLRLKTKNSPKNQHQVFEIKFFYLTFEILIYLLFRSIARNIPSLKRLGIKFVVNTAEGKTNYHVNTNHVMYQKIRLVYLGLQATDTMNFKMSQHFHKAADFIDEALASADGNTC